MQILGYRERGLRGPLACGALLDVSAVAALCTVHRPRGSETDPVQSGKGSEHPETSKCIHWAEHLAACDFEIIVPDSLS